MRLRLLILITIVFLFTLVSSAQEKESGYSLLMKFMNENSTEVDLRHIADLLKEREFAKIARDLAITYSKLKPRKPYFEYYGKTTLRHSLLEAVFRHHFDRYSNNVSILLSFIEEEWEITIREYNPEEDLLCWREVLTGVLSRYVNGVLCGKPKSETKRKILNTFDNLTEEDRVTYRGETMMFYSLTKFRNPNKYLIRILERAKQIEGVKNLQTFVHYSLPKQIFFNLRKANKKLYLREVTGILEEINRNKDARGLSLAEHLYSLVDHDTHLYHPDESSFWDISVQGSAKRKKEEQKYIESVVQLIREKVVK